MEFCFLSRLLFLSLLLASSSSQCVLNISLRGSAVARIAGANLHFKCIAIGCSINTLEVHQDGNDESGFDSGCDYGTQNSTYWEKICSVNLTSADNGSSIQCIGEPGHHKSNSIELLVQGTLAPVTGVLVRATDNNSVNVSWSPVDVYSGLPVVEYNVTLSSSNGTAATVNTDQLWIYWNTSGLDKCQYANISVVSFIDELVSNETMWYGPIQSPPSDVNLNYTAILSDNGTVSLTITLTEDCMCSGRRSTHVTLTDNSSTVRYFSHIPVTISDCTTGHITVWDETILIVDNILLMAVWLENEVGATRQDMTLLINTHSLQDGSVSNSTVVCNFTSVCLPDNNYSTGCSVSIRASGSQLMERSFIITRDKEEPSVESNLTEITSSGWYDFCFASLPSTNHCQMSLSVYIEVPHKPGNSGIDWKELLYIVVPVTVVVLLLLLIITCVGIKVSIVSRRKKKSVTGHNAGKYGSTNRETVAILETAGPDDRTTTTVTEVSELEDLSAAPINQRSQYQQLLVVGRTDDSNLPPDEKPVAPNAVIQAEVVQEEDYAVTSHSQIDRSEGAMDIIVNL